MHWQLRDTHWQLTAEISETTVMMSRLLTLSIVLLLEKAVNLRKSISTRGTKLVVSGRIQTGSYTNKDGVKVYTTEVVVEDQEFAESKNASGDNSGFAGGNNNHFKPEPSGVGDGFMNIPDGIDEELPFN